MESGSHFHIRVHFDIILGLNLESFESTIVKIAILILYIMLSPLTEESILNIYYNVEFKGSSIYTINSIEFYIRLVHEIASANIEKS